MTALDMVVCDPTPFSCCTQEMPSGKGFKKIFRLSLYKHRRSRRKQETRDYWANYIRYLSHTHFPFHTHAQKKWNWGDQTAHITPPCMGPPVVLSRASSWGTEGKAEGGVWPRVQVLSTFADRLAPVAMSHGRLSMLPASWPKGSYILSWC